MKTQKVMRVYDYQDGNLTIVEIPDPGTGTALDNFDDHPAKEEPPDWREWQGQHRRMYEVDGWVLTKDSPM